VHKLVHINPTSKLRSRFEREEASTKFLRHLPYLRALPEDTFVEATWLYRTLPNRSVCLLEPLTWVRQPVSLPALVRLRCMAASYRRLAMKTHGLASETSSLKNPDSEAYLNFQRQNLWSGLTWVTSSQRELARPRRDLVAPILAKPGKTFYGDIV
jgi:hypothetical protein